VIAVDVAYSQIGGSGQAGRPAVYLINPTSGAAKKLIEHAGHEHYTYWSRDGTWIYYHTHTPATEIFRVPASGGPPVKVTSGSFEIAAESADGRTLYGTAGTAGIERMSFDGGTREIVVPGGVLQGGTLGAVIYGRPGDDKFYLFDIHMGASKILADGIRRPAGATMSPDGKTLVVGSVDRSTMDLMLVENPK
jgi:Tol biopolymer transport system component